MSDKENGIQQKVLVAGNNSLAFSISVCILQAGDRVTVYTDNISGARQAINSHLGDLQNSGSAGFDLSNLEITDRLKQAIAFDLAIAITNETCEEKEEIIKVVEQLVSSNTIIAVNSECIPLSTLQNYSLHPDRIIAANWVEPAHTTFFLELIVNSTSDLPAIDELILRARSHWKKDAYVITGETSIRAKMLSAMAREAFFLVENGYASIEDIDRACRNDAGYYLPFAGNFRYIDLMGTAGYGNVMKDLNPTLSKSDAIPDFFKELLAEGALGMKNKKGLYSYREGDVERWNESFRKFSYEIHHIISKYPFSYDEEKALLNENSIEASTHYQ